MSHRVVSLIASATEIVCALGFEDELVGRSHECDYPPGIERLPACCSSKVKVEASSREIDDQVRSLVGDGLSVYRVDPDLLNRLAPTVIVTQTQCDVCAASLEDVERAVCELVTSNPVLVSLEPMALGDVWKDIRSVASALGDPARGDALVTRLRTRLDDLRVRTQSSQSRPTVGCIEWTDPLMMAGNWVPELVEIAGGVDPLGEAGKHSGYVEIERLAETDPDVIAIMPCGFDIERGAREMAALVAHPEWRQLSAVRAGRVVVTDGNQYFNRPGPRLVESAEILAEFLHPDQFDFGHFDRGWTWWETPEQARRRRTG
ncbi:cobalamin-binding protein [Candidatus Palauibacter irciniicola]|uniref:cobalamin-binding protein n=1 Tax=Candidatus Palauibacter irciniicola TaxID=3056733 RepID=UPI003B021D5C